MKTKLILFIILTLIITGLYSTGLFENLNDSESFKDQIRSYGTWGVLAFCLIFLAVQPIGFPGSILWMASSMIWPLQQAFLYSWLIGIISALSGFYFARYLAKDWVQNKLPDRLKRYDQHIEAKGLRTTIVIRLLFMISPPTNWLLGVSKIQTQTFLLGTSIGLMPGILMYNYFGQGVLQFYQQLKQPGSIESQYFLITVLLIVLIAATYFVLKRRQR